MRIAITGSHGTGKSTLAKVLSEKLKLPMISEVARTIIRSYGYSTNADYVKHASEHEKLKIQETILSQQIILESKEKSFVSDRSVIDPTAYAEAYGTDFVNKMKCKSIEHAFDYDFLFYVPIMFDLENDGFREATDKEFQLDIDKKIRQMVYACEHLGINVHYMDSDRLEDRVKQVFSVIEKG